MKDLGVIYVSDEVAQAIEWLAGRCGGRSEAISTAVLNYREVEAHRAQGYRHQLVVDSHRKEFREIVVKRVEGEEEAG